ncbi:uncharacterized protein LOC115565742 [Drosophila navojoa]|uniref:uncharacterized protein LOC115565742 n=1 Tax=Drosophila navojoa TaxID=7232 RepID=UPI0011BD5153|nr:uncharacterized protein LOC115565742 [Drosophila navojoa]
MVRTVEQLILKAFDRSTAPRCKALQTNYFLVFLAIYVIMIACNPMKIISGLIVQALLIAIIWQFFSSKSKTNFIASRLTGGNQILAQQNAQQKWYVLAGALLASYLFLHMISAVLLTTFTLLLPVSVTFIHASLRLRNMKNKLANILANRPSILRLSYFAITHSMCWLSFTFSTSVICSAELQLALLALVALLTIFLTLPALHKLEEIFVAASANLRCPF